MISYLEGENIKMSIRENRLKILNLLEKGPLKIKFLKADKTTREMLATRQVGHGPFLATSTSAEKEMIVSSGSGSVAVFDLDISEKRAFVFPRLLGYYDQNDTFIPYSEQNVESTIAVPSRPKNAPAELVDSDTRKDTENLVNLMRDNVLRINFLDSKGEVQTRFGTRNKKVIDAHSNHLKPLKEGTVNSLTEQEERLERDLDIGVVRYFDLMRKEFRSFNTYKLVPDTINGVPSYLVFDANGDEWFLVFKGKIPVHKLYKEGSNIAGKLSSSMKKTMGPAIQALKLAENRNIATQQFRDSLARRGDEAARTTIAVNKAKEVHKQFVELTKANKQGALTVRDQDLYADLVEYANKMKTRLELQHEGKGDDITSIVISEVKELKSVQLVALVLNFGDNVILMHPRFVVDGVSHRVLFGKRFIEFDDARLSNNPDTVKKILLDIQAIYKKYAGERLERDSKALHLRNKRAARHGAYALSNADEGMKIGLDIKPCKVGLSVLSCVTQVHPQTGQVKGRLFFNQTAAYYQPEGGKRVRIYRPTTGSVKELMNSFAQNLTKIGFSAAQLEYLLKTIHQGYSLRSVIDTTKVEKGLKIKLIEVSSDARIENTKRGKTKTTSATSGSQKPTGATKQTSTQPKAVDATHAENIKHAQRMQALANSNTTMTDEERQMANALARGLRSGEIR